MLTDDVVVASLECGYLVVHPRFSRGLLEDDSPLRVIEESVRIETFAEMVSGGAYPAPRRFGRPSRGGHDPDGFSDHYPVSVRIEQG